MLRNAVLTAALFAGAVLYPAAVMAQVDMGPSECFSCRDAPAAPTYSAPQAQPQPSQADIAAQQAEQARQQRLKEAYSANEQGIAFYNKQDWAQAVALFQEAVAKNPDDANMQTNLAHAQAALASAQAKVENQQRDKAAAQHMQEAIQGFAQTLKTAPVAGGLDFDGGNSSSSTGAGTSGGLDFTTTVTAAKPAAPAAGPSGDPNVVDARNVPSGLSKPVENAITDAYRDAPPGVSDRVRKGFQAVASNDWKVAKAWFEDALNRDPGNADLKRLVATMNEPPKAAGQPAGQGHAAVSRHTRASLNANASKMSTEQVMDALVDILVHEDALRGFKQQMLKQQAK